MSAYQDLSRGDLWKDLTEKEKFVKVFTDAFPKLSTAIKAASTASTAAGGGFSGLAAGAKAMAASLGLATTAFSVFAAVAAAAVIGVSAYRAHMESIRQSAADGASTFSAAQSSIDEYTNKVKELHAALAEGTLTESEAYAAKKELFEIQSSLVDTYGKQAAGIDLVNGSLEEQIKNLERLSLLEAQHFLNENRSGIDMAIREMTKTLGGDAGWFTTGGEYMGQYYNNGSDESNRLNSILSKYTNIKQYSAGEDGLVTIRFVGDATEAKETLNDLMTDLREADREFDNNTFIFSDIFDYASSIYNEADKIIEKYQDIYEQGMKAKLIEESVGDNPITYGEGDNLKTAAEWLSAYTDAVKEYNDALSSGDTGKISAARLEFEALNGTIAGLLSDSKGLGQYAFMFNEISGALNQSAISAQTFKESIDRFPQESERLKAAGMTDTQFASAFIDGLGSDATSRAVKSILEQYANAFGLEFGNLTISQVGSAARILANMGILQKDTRAQKQSETKPASERLSALWDSEGFADSKTKLRELAQTAEGITADKIKDLAKDSKELASILDESGISARFLAHVFSEEIAGNHGFDLVTQDMLELDAALNSAAGLFDEVTAARERYNAASSAGEYDDSFKSFSQAFSTLQSQMDDGKQGKQFWAAAEYIFGSGKLEEWGYDVQNVAAAMANAKDILSDADSGGMGFLDKLYGLAEGGKVKGADGSVLAEIQKLSDGSYKFNVDLDQIDALSDKMGVSKEAIMSCMEALKLFGDVSFFDADRSIKKFQDMGIASSAFNKTAINVEALKDTLHDLGYSGKDIYDIVSQLQGLNDVTLVDIYGDINNVITGLKDLGIATQSGEGITIDADQFAQMAQSLSLSADQASNLFNRLKDVEGVQFVKDGQLVDDIQFEDVDKKINVTAEVDESAVDEFEGKDLDREATVTFNVDSSSVDAYNPSNLFRTLTYTIVVNGNVPQFADGTKGAPGGPSLVGEEGEELIQSGNKAYFVGSDGPEIVNLNKGDIVYTAAETKSIKAGRIFASGVIPSHRYANSENPSLDYLPPAKTVATSTTQAASAAASAAAAAAKAAAEAAVAKAQADSKKLTEQIKSSQNGSANGTVKSGSGSSGGGSGGSGGGGSGGSGGSSSSSNKEQEKIDWIERSIKKVEREIEKLKKVATGAFKSLSTKMTASRSEIDKVTEAIRVQSDAAAGYLREANSVELNESLKQKVRDGSIEIARYGEETQKLIEEYQKWYDKSLECSDAIDELHESLASLYQERFDAIKSDFDNQIGLIEHDIKSIDNNIDVLEARGYMSSAKYYEQIQQNNQKSLAALNSEVSALEKSLKEAMASGEIEEGSEAWYSMKNAINETNEKIGELNLSIVETANTIRQIKWDIFDYGMEKISAVTDEAEFLISLMSYSDLFDKTGQLTDEGLATLGLYGEKMNVYMAEADKYAAEIKRLDEEIAKDPYNKDLIERRNELVKAQRESILAAQNEKASIKDLVSQGIDVQLKSMQDLIDKYNESLDSAKDLYDYQKKVKSQTENLKSIQKQLSAYQNDDSEEARARVQKLTVSLKDAQDQLEETEYQQYISDQKKLLNDLYDDYESSLNERLDDMEALVSDVITNINGNGASICDTLHSVSKDIGYQLGDVTKNIWNGSTLPLDGILTTYGNDFSSKLTGVNGSLNNIQNAVVAMAEHSDSIAEGSIPRYKRGGKVDFTGLAFMDGTPSDPETVLNARDSENLIALRDLLRRNLDFSKFTSTGMPTIDAHSDIGRLMGALGSFNDRGTVFGDTNVQIDIDHVENYSDFVNKLREDPNFDRMIRAMTVDRLNGGSTIAKTKYRW